MSTGPQDPGSRGGPRTPGAQSAADRPTDALTQEDAEARADIEEDRRRQRALDEAELGGEA
ncbi:hypothetical protein [Geodermatophilus marinus]|uniref:hypothetical protein n=1 Tax=Geodermatophilus sp. LHW52908 TaxID=2303986 RepID=UPI000E3C541E|nr:hypothetical protein [Geodermatophilus sp. LHW52908]RFU19215.1 hypothetical protein D0Z06_22735 [Geodermatophilus sp. LHW52908]